MSSADRPVALVTMPFGAVTSPSLGIGLLKASLQQHAIPSAVHCFNLAFAAQIGVCNYDFVAESFPPPLLVGEWLFAPALFGSQPEADAGYVEEILWSQLGDYITPVDVLELLRLREQATGFVDACFQAVKWDEYLAVGFSVCTQQLCASLALAQRIKTHHPEVQIILGGANCTGAMGVGLSQAFPFVDYVCLGEGELALPRLVQALAAEGPGAVVPGMAGRATAAAANVRTPEYVAALDSLPYPDYTDYIAQLAQYFGAQQPRWEVPFETTRGCWWAVRQPCHFCSAVLPQNSLRSKAPDRVLAEIDHLIAHYGANILVTDVAINPRYHQSLLPALAGRVRSDSLFWEVRADVTRTQVAQMAAAGVTRTLLGIESFSDVLLASMHKGTTCLQNIQALKWCREFGIAASWNFLYGVPGEDPQAYAAQAALLPLLFHLSAPRTFARVRLEQGNAYLKAPAAYGIEQVRPSPIYRYVYPGLSAEEVAGFAFYFEGDFAHEICCYSRELADLVEAWQGRTDAVLDLFQAGDEIRIVDTRTCGVRKEHRFDGAAAALYLACDAAQSVRRLEASMGIDAATVIGSLDRFVELGLMVCAGEGYLSLAVQCTRPHATALVEPGKN